MNVVSKFGSFITQGVYSVATPFHPFGGAVDIIVVEQEDGSYRSTPWYVRFGKFQGVLKGAEKIVRISVNGTEANFHMYLDNSGEAYFVKEEQLEEGRETADENGNTQENEELFEFNEGSALDGNSTESAEYSYRYENINEVHDLAESSQDLKSEMVLYSVDGHVLTAPISSSEETMENVQLTIPQFHLGHVEESDEGFASRGKEWGGNLFLDTLVKESTDPDSRIDEFVACEEPSDPSINVKSGESPGCDTSYDTINGRAQLEDHVDTCVSLSTSPGFDSSNDSVGNSVSLSPSLGQKIANDDTKGDHDSNILSMHIESHEERLVIHNSESNRGSVSVSVESLDMNLDVKYEQVGSIQGHSSTQDIQLKEGTVFNMGYEISLCGNLMRAGMNRKSAEEVFEAHRVSKEEFESSSQSIVKNKNLVLRFRGKYLTWDAAAPIILGKVVFDLDMPVDCKNCIFIEEDGSSGCNPSPSTLTMSPSSRRWRLWPIRRVKTLQRTESSSSSEEVFLDSDSFLQSPRSDSLVSNRLNDGQSPGKCFVRTNCPTTEQIASLNLKEGQNTIAFSFSTRVLGRQQVDAHVYLWKWNARIVISDVDGTITKSDVLGQFMPLVGRDWTQSGVARLFSAIKENGYQLLFLSARAIVQAYLTRSFLLNLKQDGKALPNGPVVISPDGLFPSLYREVIRRTPHEFKIACLEDIRALFPSDYNPFYAGFGNRDTDELSYRKIGIPRGKVFIINPKGEVAVNHSIDVKSYTSLHTLVNDMFPPTSVVEQEDFNSWNYWKMPLPSVDF
ncbi:lipin family protein [Wolffia australiana]